ncbi:protein Daple-like [Simochromis diagramma]|uniref:protein Daple-like n=1 Tax=Simochromis diagramma TaxID=43689 RepID=UPI001A7F105B|nr:protein Daple-like [Simochromis diagramma]
MSNQEGKPEFVFTLPKSALDNLMLVRKALQNSLTENKLLKEGESRARQQIKHMMTQISNMRTKLELYENQAAGVTDESVSRKPQVSSATKEKEQQTCSDQEKVSNLDLEMNCLKEQLQQRDNEILMLKQEKDTLSAKFTQLQKHERYLKETMWNALWKEQTLRENLEQEKKVLEEQNKKLLEEQKVVNDTKEEVKEAITKCQDAEKEEKELEEDKKALQPQSEDSSEIKESQAETNIPEMQTELDTQRKELVESQTETQETATPESSSSDCLSGEKLCVNKVIELVVSQAIEQVSTKYKLFTERLTADCISDRLMEKIWPEIELKHLDLSPKWLKNIDKAILKDLCKTHKCKGKYLIFNLREQLDSITVPTFTKHLLALPTRVLSVSKHREEYQEAVKNVTKDLVMHAMKGENEAATWNAGTSEFIVQRLSHKIWNKILSKSYKMSMENIEQLGLKVANDLREKWPSPILLMRSSNPVVDEAVVSIFKKHAKLRSQNVILRVFSCAR